MSPTHFDGRRRDRIRDRDFQALNRRHKQEAGRLLSDTLNLMAIHHAADIIDDEQNTDDLHVLKEQNHENERPVTIHDVANLLWKHSTKNGEELQQRDSSGKRRVYHQLMDSQMPSDRAHSEYTDTLHNAHGGHTANGGTID